MKTKEQLLSEGITPADRIKSLRLTIDQLADTRDAYAHAPDCPAYVNITLAIAELEATIASEGKGWTEWKPSGLWTC